MELQHPEQQYLSQGVCKSNAPPILIKIISVAN